MTIKSAKYPTAGAQTARQCALFVAIRSFALANSRLLLMNRLLGLGWRVVAAGNADQYVDRLTEAGVEFVEVPFDRGRFASWRDWTAYHRLTRIYRELNPTLVHHFQAKPVILGCAAARFCPRAKVVNTITGLGHTFIAGGIPQRVASIGYRLMLRRADRTIFQNPDDRDLFLTQGMVSRSASELIVSSGVDVERFRPSTTARADSLHVVMLSRLLWEKGVGEFVDAAKRCKRRLPNARFQIAGEFDPDHPSGIPPKVVDQWVAEGAVEYLGHVSNVPELLSQATLAVLPSYREGVPRVLLEAAACGIPVITCDAPGCREAVENRVTGLLVPPKDADALADAMSMLLSDAELRRRMGLAGRRRIEIHFDQRVIVDKHLELYRRIGLPLKLSEKRLTPHALVA